MDRQRVIDLLNQKTGKPEEKDPKDLRAELMALEASELGSQKMIAGQYKDQTVEEVFKKNPSYATWCIQHQSANKKFFPLMIYAERQVLKDQKNTESTKEDRGHASHSEAPIRSPRPTVTPSSNTAGESVTRSDSGTNNPDRISLIEKALYDLQQNTMTEMQMLSQVLQNLQTHNMQIQEALMTVESRVAHLEAEMKSRMTRLEAEVSCIEHLSEGFTPHRQGWDPEAGTKMPKVRSF